MTERRVRVVTSGDLPGDLKEWAIPDAAELRVARTEEELRAAVREAEVLYTWRVPDEVPSDTPDLRWIHVSSAGVDHLVGSPVWKSDILLTASQGIHAVPMTEHLFALLFALTRHVPDMVRAQDRTEWGQGWRPRQFSELYGKTMAIVGWGKIGDSIAHAARAFGMRVIGTRWSVVVAREVSQSAVGPYSDPPWLELPDTAP